MSRILFTKWGVCLSACWDNTTPPLHPQEQTPPPGQTPLPGADPPGHTPQEQTTPPGQTPPGPGTPPLLEQSMLADTVNERVVCILLECNLVKRVFTVLQITGMPRAAYLLEDWLNNVKQLLQRKAVLQNWLLFNHLSMTLV